MNIFRSVLLFFMAAFTCHKAIAQPITGVWKGRVDGKRVELKLIQKGDSILGTAYYPGVLKDYKRFSVKGYFDQADNSIVWLNDQQLHPPVYVQSGREFISADYSCPGGTKMFLTSDPLKKDAVKVDVTKVPRSAFVDEWDYVLENYDMGANNPKLIDSIGRIATTKSPVEPVLKDESIAKNYKTVVIDVPGTRTTPARKTANQPEPKVINNPPLVFLDRKDIPEGKVNSNKPAIKTDTAASKRKDPKPVMTREEPVLTKTNLPSLPRIVTNQDRLNSRKKEFAMEIPVSGDTIELRFYDNAEIDGDSISLFLNNKLLMEHIRLTGFAHVIRIAVADLKQENELVMVAENLGTIPPNTAYMMALVGGLKYDAQIVSTEETSALIRLRKP